MDGNGRRKLEEKLATEQREYEFDADIAGNDELLAFVRRFWALHCEMHPRRIGSNVEAMKAYLVTMREFVISELGESSSLFTDIDMALDSLASSVDDCAAYYDDVLYIRAAFGFDEPIEPDCIG